MNIQSFNSLAKIENKCSIIRTQFLLFFFELTSSFVNTMNSPTDKWRKACCYRGLLPRIIKYDPSTPGTRIIFFSRVQAPMPAIRLFSYRENENQPGRIYSADQPFWTFLIHHRRVWRSAEYSKLKFNSKCPSDVFRKQRLMYICSVFLFPFNCFWI